MIGKTNFYAIAFQKLPKEKVLEGEKGREERRHQEGQGKGKEEEKRNEDISAPEEPLTDAKAE